MNKRVNLKIYGLVQGVGYRYMAQNEAKKLGFSGWVKNLDDGSVELVVEGEEQDLKDFINWCYNGVGPAQVLKIEEGWEDPTGQFEDFVIK